MARMRSDPCTRGGDPTFPRLAMGRGAAAMVAALGATVEFFGSPFGDGPVSQRAPSPPNHLDPSRPIYVMVGAALCRLEIWSEREWADLPDECRPRAAEHVPDLGWVGVVPVESMN